LDHLLHRLCPELIRVLLAVAHKHLGHCHQLWQPDVYERLAGPSNAHPIAELSSPSRQLILGGRQPFTEGRAAASRHTD
ncbi:hypothetical protein, partial [Stenotrophomonas maltophilia group sp. Smal12]|uniref:hypothetical protein n=1 Tax=Stenotrophomonas maltophilia group sp. Smal12 TaxID=3050414 RepID=UPI00300E7E92